MSLPSWPQVDSSPSETPSSIPLTCTRRLAIFVALSIIVSVSFISAVVQSFACVFLPAAAYKFLLPNTTYGQASVGSTFAFAAIGAMLVHIPSCLFFAIPLAIKLDQCCAARSLEPAQAFARRWTPGIERHPLPYIALAIIWVTLAGPIGAFAYRSWFPMNAEAARALSPKDALGVAVVGRVALHVRMYLKDRQDAASPRKHSWILGERLAAFKDDEDPAEGSKV